MKCLCSEIKDNRVNVLLFVILVQEITKIVYHVNFHILYTVVLNMQGILYFPVQL